MKYENDSMMIEKHLVEKYLNNIDKIILPGKSIVNHTFNEEKEVTIQSHLRLLNYESVSTVKFAVEMIHY